MAAFRAGRRLRRVRRVKLLLLLSILVLAAAAVHAQSANLIRNPDFSLGVDDEGVPLEWVNFGGSPLNRFELTKERATLGEFSLKLTDVDPEGSGGMRSHRVPAAAGDRFRLQVDVFVERGSAMVYLDFHTASGARVDAVSTNTGVTGNWHTVTLEGTAPAGTDHVTVILYVNIPNTGVAYFDNVRLYKL